MPTRNQDHTVGRFNYLSDAVESSLYRNGKVRMLRDADGSDRGYEGLVRSSHETSVRDARALPADQRPSLAANGFELCSAPLAGDPVDFLDLEQIVERYYPQCARVVEEATGGRAVAFDHNVRSVVANKGGARISGGQQVQRPVHMVHGDYTLATAPQRLRDLANPPSRNDTLRTVLNESESLVSRAAVERVLADGERFAIVNLWRNIADQPVVSHPLALCDGRSVDPEDLVVFEIHYEDRVGENYFAKYRDHHAWYYFPEMARDEALLIKQWDSAGPLARTGGRQGDSSDLEAPSTFSFHSAFEDPATPDEAPDRRSIEVRCMVLYE